MALRPRLAKRRPEGRLTPPPGAETGEQAGPRVVLAPGQGERSGRAGGLRGRGLERRGGALYAGARMHGGIEWLVDLHGCAPARLRDRAAVVGALDRVVAAMDLHVVSTAVHVFPGEGGVTAMYLLSESHLAIHTFPETGTATLNAYCCRPRPGPPWQALLGELLGARDVRVTEIARGQAP